MLTHLPLFPGIPIVKPTEIDAPPGLRLSLLPFQRESLYWMKEQEKGIWKGGMLAGMSSNFLSSFSD